MLSQIAIIALVFGVFVMFGLVFVYSFYLGKLVERDSEVYKKAENVLIEAHKKAKALIDQASDKAKVLLSEAEVSKSIIETEFKSSMRDASGQSLGMFKEQSEQMAKAYQALFEEIRTVSMKEVKDTLENLEKEGEAGLSAFRSSLKDQQLTSQYYIEKRLNQEFDNAHKEILAYKQDQLHRVEQSVDKIILRLSEEILGKAISLDSHEKLVYEALNKLKDEGLFS